MPVVTDNMPSTNAERSHVSLRALLLVISFTSVVFAISTAGLPFVAAIIFAAGIFVGLGFWRAVPI